MGHIDLPPVETLTLRNGVAVVIIVPPLPRRQKGKPEAITTRIVRAKPTASVSMTKRVDREGDMIKQCGTAAERNGNQLPTVGSEYRMPRLQPLPQRIESHGKTHGAT